MTRDADGSAELPSAALPEVGLCSVCRRAALQANPRGSRFWRCRLSDTDARFLRYPPLPVRRCVGHERGEPEGTRSKPPRD